MIDYVGIASQMIIVGGCLECVVIMTGYIVITVLSLMKAR